MLLPQQVARAPMPVRLDLVLSWLAIYPEKAVFYTLLMDSAKDFTFLFQWVSKANRIKKKN